MDYIAANLIDMDSPLGQEVKKYEQRKHNRPPLQEQIDALERKYERLRDAIGQLIVAQATAMQAIDQLTQAAKLLVEDD